MVTAGDTRIHRVVISVCNHSTQVVSLYMRRRSGYTDTSVTGQLKCSSLLHGRSCKEDHVQKSIKVISGQVEPDEAPPGRLYQRFEIPRLWFGLGLPLLLLTNVTSMSNKIDELVTTVRSVKAGAVAITEARQIIPVSCYTEGYELFHHIRTN